ncbi:MAG: diaminopimelate epimerase [Clostridia bacterium]|nr:diaminopimelate epimerase [Clostridia bacterium]
MRFTKMQAFGNDYVYIDAINQKLPNLSALARFVSDRHFAIGSDGMVLICPSSKADFRMRMFNPDGTEGEMCGNALRSVGKYVYDHALTDKTELTIETLGGIQHLWLTVENRDARDGERQMPYKNRGFVSNIRANIGKPRLDTKVIPVLSENEKFVEQPVEILDKTFNITAVSWGNPHTAMFVSDLNFDVHKYGREIEYKTELFPNKTNVTFAQLISRDYIKIREWERGTGETIGCGTGCATAVVAGVLTGRCDRTVTVEQIGGPLLIEWDEKTGDMFMTGESHNVFEGEIDITHLGD